MYFGLQFITILSRFRRTGGCMWISCSLITINLGSTSKWRSHELPLYVDQSCAQIRELHCTVRLFAQSRPHYSPPERAVFYSIIVDVSRCQQLTPARDSITVLLYNLRQTIITLNSPRFYVILLDIVVTRVYNCIIL